MFFRKLIRFRLITVLIVFASVAGFFGYAKWKHERIQNEYDLLTKNGVQLEMSLRRSSWMEFFATGSGEVNAPNKATIHVEQVGEHEYQIAQREISWKELEVELASLHKRAENLSIPSIRAEMFMPTRFLTRESDRKMMEIYLRLGFFLHRISEM